MGQTGRRTDGRTDRSVVQAGAPSQVYKNDLLERASIVAADPRDYHELDAH